MSDTIGDDWASEAVADKGYHSNGTMMDLQQMQVRSYISEPARGRRNWRGRNWRGRNWRGRNWRDGRRDGEDGVEAREATYANRHRIKGERGKALLRKRGEFIERSFAHSYETGAMRRLHLRHRENIAKRVLIHVAGFNLGVLLRVRYGLRKPRGQGRAALRALWDLILMWSGLPSAADRLRIVAPMLLVQFIPSDGAVRLQAA